MLSEKERRELIQEIKHLVGETTGSAVVNALQLGGRSGFVSKEQCEATKGLFLDTQQAITSKLENVDKNLLEMKLDMVRKNGFHDGLRDAENSQTEIKKLRVSWIGSVAKWVGVALAFLSLVVSGVYFVVKVTSKSVGQKVIDEDALVNKIVQQVDERLKGDKR